MNSDLENLIGMIKGVAYYRIHNDANYIDSYWDLDVRTIVEVRNTPNYGNIGSYSLWFFNQNGRLLFVGNYQ